jgi:hypothetical protein
LLEKVDLLGIHRFRPQDVQFPEALVSSAVVWFRKSVPGGRPAVFSFGGTLSAPAESSPLHPRELSPDSKWPPGAYQASAEPTVGDYFHIKRGLATGSDGFFILTAGAVMEHFIEPGFLRPILPPPKKVAQLEIEAGPDGDPLIPQRRYLLDCRLPEDRAKDYPGLWAYLESGREGGLPQGYLCRRRHPWYLQERREPPPLICTYMARGPFRFIWNRSSALVTNSYLGLYPKGPAAEAMAAEPALGGAIREALAAIGPGALSTAGRVYGGGLKKLEPSELAKVPIPGLERLIPGRRG